MEEVSVKEGKPNKFITIVNVLKDESIQAEGPNAKCKRRSFRKVLMETVIRWGCESENEGTKLVREKFKVLADQYYTIGKLES